MKKAIFLLLIIFTGITFCQECKREEKPAYKKDIQELQRIMKLAVLDLKKDIETGQLNSAKENIKILIDFINLQEIYTLKAELKSKIKPGEWKELLKASEEANEYAAKLLDKELARLELNDQDKIKRNFIKYLRGKI